MKNFQNADLAIAQNLQDKTNSLSKSADILSTKNLIFNLNDSIIHRKSKEYNFDFNKACSSDANQTNSGLLKLSEESLAKFNFQNNNNKKELKLIGRKTSFQINSDTDAKLEIVNATNNQICSSNHNNQNSQNVNYNACNNFNAFKMKQNVNNIPRNSTNEAFKKLKERLNMLQQKKNFEFFETKAQKEEDNENDDLNVFFE